MKQVELPQIFELHFAELTQLCLQFGVSKLYAFGSVLTTHFDETNSDLDLLVELEEMPPLQQGENLINLWSAMESLFSRKVDLLTERALHNPYLKANVDPTQLSQSFEQTKKSVVESKK